MGLGMERVTGGERDTHREREKTRDAQWGFPAGIYFVRHFRLQ